MLTNTGLVIHCKKALSEKWGYVWGTFGLVLTERLLAEKISQYPEGVGSYKTFIRNNWLGRRTSDCIGLIKSYMWWIGNGPVYQVYTDISANDMYYKAKNRGSLSNMQSLPGLCLWKAGHIGVYIGNNQVIEARGTQQGVIKTPLKGPGANNWTYWLKCPYITYSNPLLSIGMKSDDVVILQLNLNRLGYGLTVDGDFGKKTESSVRDFQSEHNLTADGIAGLLTITAIDKLVYK